MKHHLKIFKVCWVEFRAGLYIDGHYPDLHGVDIVTARTKKQVKEVVQKARPEVKIKTVEILDYLE